MPVDLLEGGIVEDLALTSRSEDDELVAEVPADWPRFSLHRHGLDAHPLERAQISEHLLVIALPRASLIKIEAVSVLHQELSSAHHSEARPNLVPELPLDVVERARQVAVALHFVAEQRGDHLLVGRTVEHLAFVTVADAQHLGPVGVVAAALAPQIGRLQRGHQHFLRSGAVLLLAHDLLDVLQDPETQREPRVDSGRRLPHEARPKHQLVADDLGVCGTFLENGQERSGPTHGAALYGARLRLATARHYVRPVAAPTHGPWKKDTVSIQPVTVSESRRSKQRSGHTGPWVGFGVAATRLGTFRRDVSKGADEQSSRRAPGSLADPGVCAFMNVLT